MLSERQSKWLVDLPWPCQPGTAAVLFRAPVKHSRHRQVLQGEAGHVEYRDIAGLPVDDRVAGQYLAQIDARQRGSPLAFADLPGLGLVVGEQPDPVEQPW